MTNEYMQTNTQPYNAFPIGARLQSAREALGIERKDAAAQLRLSETVITALEQDAYPADLPATFVRGYIRLYGKFLQVPDYEIKQALEPIQPKMPTPEEFQSSIKPEPTLTSSNYFMQIATAGVIITLLTLVVVWWVSHNKAPLPITENKTIALPLETNTINTITPANNNPVAPVPTANNTTSLQPPTPAVTAPNLPPPNAVKSDTATPSIKAKSSKPAYVSADNSTIYDEDTGTDAPKTTDNTTSGDNNSDIDNTD